MAEQRRHIRVDDGEKCLLLQGKTYSIVIIKNISLSGALLHYNGSPTKFNVGDNCQVSLDMANSYYYDCEVVRVDDFDFAVKFIDMNTPAAVAN